VKTNPANRFLPPVSKNPIANASAPALPRHAMAKKAQATWGGRFSSGPAGLMLRIGESVSVDHRLAPFDIQGSKAHSAMLAKAGLLTKADRDAIHDGLDEIGAEIESGRFKFDPSLEDIHMNIEQALTKRVPAAARLHAGRSRNDQVAADMRLYLKSACAGLRARIRAAQRAMLAVAKGNHDVLIPGYTHMQRAQPVFLAHHFFAYLEMLQRDAERFEVVSDRANWCPLGAGAIAGTTLPINRELTAKLLGFVDSRGRPRVTQNSMDSVSDRDVMIEFASACALMGVHLSRMAEDLILWTAQEFRLIELPDEFCTGSSLMPQKKNPDSMELIRGKSARLQGNLQSLLTLMKGLPLTYNRDMQEDKQPVFDSHDQVGLCLEVIAATIAGIKVNRENCAAAVADPALLATDLADYLVLKGIPFREAHHAVGAVVKLAEQNAIRMDQLPLEVIRGVHPEFGPDWVGSFDLAKAMRRRVGTGMPGFAQMKKQAARWKRLLA
jgi:argininosuccinate lyase